MDGKNIVFIATSIDGYIADKQGKVDWLHKISMPDNNDMGFQSLMDEVDAIVMGRTTYETVRSFGIDWPYSKHVYVLSTSITSVPDELGGRVSIMSGEVGAIVTKIHEQGHCKLYIDGGRTIQDFLKADLIDELRITTIPVLLGGGFSLFGDLVSPIWFEHTSTEVFNSTIVQNRFSRRR